MVEPLRILSYNVRYFGHALRGLASTRMGKRSIARGIASLTPLPQIVCLQEVETSSLRSTLAFRPTNPEETQLESFMAELERAFEELDRPFPYEAFYFRAHANRIGRLQVPARGGGPGRRAERAGPDPRPASRVPHRRVSLAAHAPRPPLLQRQGALAGPRRHAAVRRSAKPLPREERPRAAHRPLRDRRRMNALDVLCFGEALVDLLPAEGVGSAGARAGAAGGGIGIRGKLRDCERFEMQSGGAPAN